MISFPLKMKLQVRLLEFTILSFFMESLEVSVFNPTMSYPIGQGTLLNVRWQTGGEVNLGETGYKYMYGRVPFLST